MYKLMKIYKPKKIKKMTENEMENFVHTHTEQRFSQIEYNLKLKYITYFVSERLFCFFSLTLHSVGVVVVVVHLSE